MKNKTIVKKLIIISIIILIIGAVFGFAAKMIISNSVAEQNMPAENIVGIGGDFSPIIRFVGDVFAIYIGVGIFILSAIIDLIIWIVYGIVSFIRKKKKKNKE